MAKPSLLCSTITRFQDNQRFTKYGWIKKGVRKELPANTGRARLNLSGAIDIIDQRLVMHEDLTLNAASTIPFFNKIEEAYPDKRRMHIFCDNFV